MLTKKKVLTNILLIFSIIILFNIIGNRFFFRLDFTEDHQYTLNEATKNILNSLDAPVTITAYFSENMPPNVAKVKDDFKDMLIEYNSVSDGQIQYDFINPNVDQKTETEAQRAGIRPVLINVRERDQVKQQRAYLGAVLEYKNKKEIIPVIQPGAAMEYDLTTSIKKLTLTHKTKIAFLQGNGEPELSALQQLTRQLSIMYNIQPFAFSDTTKLTNDYKTLVIIAPADSINPKYLNQMDDYISNGGRILLALNRVTGDLSKATGSVLSTGFNNWLKNYGVNVEGKFIIDISSGSVMVRQNQGGFVMNTPVKFPYLPIITNFADHPISKGIESVIMQFASPIEITPDSSVKYTVFAKTSKATGIETPPVYFNVMKRWTRGEFPLSNLPVAVALEGKFKNGTYSKMVVFSDGDFVINGNGQQKRRLEKDNISIMSNAIDWLSDDTGLIALRTKGVTNRPIDSTLKQGTKTFIKYLNFLLPIILIIIYGLVRYQIKKKKRNKWMNEKYV
ncbi:MAG TPA: hypothetical protein ENI76_09815 [Ignavibacteria bacterium]|nr:hypothetical protein [Ignavibacteria bacterium]